MFLFKCANDFIRIAFLNFDFRIEAALDEFFDRLLVISMERGLIILVDRIDDLESRLCVKL